MILRKNIDQKKIYKIRYKIKLKLRKIYAAGHENQLKTSKLE